MSMNAMSAQEFRVSETERLVSEAPNILAELFLALDARDYQTLTNCFMAEGVWNRQGRDLAGAEEIVAALKQERSPTLITVHAVSNVAVTMGGAAEGSARFYLTVFRHDDGTFPKGPVPVPRPTVVGLSIAEFVRQANGWRIKFLKTGPYAFIG